MGNWPRHLLPVTVMAGLLFGSLPVLLPAQTATLKSKTLPDGPKIINPANRVVVPDELRIVTEAGPADHLSTEIEIWGASGNKLVEKVWRTSLESGDLTTATLEDGRFEAGVDSLAPWNRYAIMARYGTASGFTNWGPKRIIRTDDGSQNFFDPAVIGDIRLEIPGASWGPIGAEALAPCARHLRSYHPGTVTIDSTEFAGSGIRAKGGCGSSRPLQGKAGFKAHLSWDDPAVEGCPNERRHQGLKRITLNNQVQDASFVHERIGYDFLARLGVPVPRAAPTRLHVNGEFWGLYLNLETVDRRFMSRHFDSNDGMLYEADYGCDVGEESCFEEKFDTDSCDEPRAGDVTNVYPLRSLNGRLSQLPSDNIYPRIRQIIDFDRYLTMWAAASVMGYFDGYPYEPNNYRIYHDIRTDLWTVIPTGIDQIFERDVDPFNPVGMLSIRCLAEEDCRAAFRKRLAEVIDIFEANNYPAMARSIAQQIRAVVEADPRKEISMDDWRTAVERTVEYIRRRPGQLRDLLAQTETNEEAGENFYFHALTDPRGERYIFITWAIPASKSASGPHWIVAKGFFEVLDARMEAFEMRGGSADGVKVGTMDVGYADCETAFFRFRPDDKQQEAHTRFAPIDPRIWKYCPLEKAG